MNDKNSEVLAPDVHPTGQHWPEQNRTREDQSEKRPTALRRISGALLIAGPLVYFVAEFIAAAAWADPPYSYTYHFISNLGVHGPSVLFGQYMYSPLAWVMNTGFFVFGITIFAGVAMLRGLVGWRHWLTLVPATMLAAGGILLALFPGSGEAMNDGTGEFHSMGAFAGFVGGNVLAIFLGVMRRRVGLSLKIGRTLTVLGCLGLVAMVGYLVDIISGANVLVGLVERGAVYPFLTGLICVGVATVNRGRRSAQPGRE
ncbi:DUF998 domain-containing protein [Paramicrobacterium chengjingii]|uniref:DUF998 domain-containing protein n=1 Tax=Paramicrobacterium chengjingii TaxID=2769067 RepID=A0ABX6YI48_9MICO|nr:DUF998 domain-containing protein [Microbacterium chengjingii]QPZ38375.1 DUF998 domain-containing protein [Microbacterium chengjingii]